MIIRENLATSVLEISLNRNFIRLLQGTPHEHSFVTVPDVGMVILAVILFLSVLNLFLLQNFENYQESPSLRKQRFRPTRTASQVLAPIARASWGPKSPARAGLPRDVDYVIKLNPLALPWRPEGSSVKPPSISPVRHLQWRSQVALDPNPHVWTLASSTPRSPQAQHLGKMNGEL